MPGIWRVMTLRDRACGRRSGLERGTMRAVKRIFWGRLGRIFQKNSAVLEKLGQNYTFDGRICQSFVKTNTYAENCLEF